MCSTPPMPSPWTCAEMNCRRRALRRGAGRCARRRHGRPAKATSLTLQAALYLPVMQYASNRALRETLYRAYVTRASEFGPPNWTTQAADARAAGLAPGRGRPAGPRHFADMSLVPKMARSPQEVLAFLRDLAAARAPLCRARTGRTARFAPRANWACRPAGLGPPYASEKLKQARYAFSSRRSSSTSPNRGAGDGLFRLVETLFEVAIRPDTAPVWHDSVRFYRVERAAAPMAAFYLDLHARSGKQSGAWMDDARARWRRPTAHCRRPWPPGVQLRAARGRPARAADARRRDHAVPRVRPRPAPHADAGGRLGGVGHCRASRATRWNCPASSWRTSAGNGKCCSA
jgi:oligopeptidase A